MVEQAQKRAKKKVLGTGKVSAENKTDKWIAGMVDQAQNLESSINAKQVPVELVIPDPKNPRELSINIQDIRAVTNEQPFDEKAREDVEAYLQRTDKFFSGKASKSCMDNS